MSKSDGNTLTVRELSGRGSLPRHPSGTSCLSAHYRSELNFTRARLGPVGERSAATQRFSQPAWTGPLHRTVLPAASAWWPKRRWNSFDEALSDDLNTPEALSAVFGFVRDVNAALGPGGPEYRKLDLEVAPGCVDPYGCRARACSSSWIGRAVRTDDDLEAWIDEQIEATSKGAREVGTSPKPTGFGTSSPPRGSCWRIRPRGRTGSAREEAWPDGCGDGARGSSGRRTEGLSGCLLEYPWRHPSRAPSEAPSVC